jgi:hypothetical protein
MSLAAFQSAMLRLIADPAFRDAVTARETDALGSDLTSLETSRLQRIASDRGLDINRTLHKGFRLGKLRALLPLTCRLLGARRLARELPVFWQQRPPASFSFLPEALDFCDWLARRRLRIRYLGEVLAYERALLELERARTDAAPIQVVRFRHDPAPLLAALADDRRPRAIAVRPCRAIGWRDANGAVRWRIRDTPATSHT